LRVTSVARRSDALSARADRIWRVLATSEFEEVEITSRADAYGGMIAANRALHRSLYDLPISAPSSRAADEKARLAPCSLFENAFSRHLIGCNWPH